MGSRPTFAGQNTFGGEHSVNIIRLGEGANHDHVLLELLSHSLGGIRIKINLPDRGSR